jgi:hypothetical protein
MDPVRPPTDDCRHFVDVAKTNTTILLKRARRPAGLEEELSEPVLACLDRQGWKSLNTKILVNLKERRKDESSINGRSSFSRSHSLCIYGGGGGDDDKVAGSAYMVQALPQSQEHHRERMMMMIERPIN